DEVTLQTPTRAGYEFVQWNTAANGSGTSHNTNTPYTMPAANTTLYAIWVKIVSVTYDTQGGASVSPSSGRAGTNTWFKGAPLRAGYQFVHWNSAPDGTGTAYDEYDAITLPQNDF